MWVDSQERTFLYVLGGTSPVNRWLLRRGCNTRIPTESLYALAGANCKKTIAYPTEHWQDCSGEEGRRGYGPHRVARERSATTKRPPAAEA